MTDHALAGPDAGADGITIARRPPHYVFVLSGGLALQFMSGQASGFGFPIAPDRLFLPLGIALFLAHPDCRRREWKIQTIHVLLLAAAIWCLASMVWSGTISSADARFAWWDAYGVMPFLLFLTTPVIYETAERRRVLSVAMTSLGAYIGLIATLQGFRLESLIYPRYIVDPQSPHYGRAFGPSLEAGNNGLQLFACMVCAAILSTQVRGTAARWACRGVAVLCAVGLFLTMTRSVWIGATLGVVVALWLDRRTRKWLFLSVLPLFLALLGALALDNTLREMVLARFNDAESAYDRINANATAFNVLQYRPLSGVGFDNFSHVEDDWFWQRETTPVAATSIAVHNVFLGRAAELGLPGAALWLVALMRASTGLLRRLPRDREQRLWRQAATGYVVCWFAQAMLMPINYALPSSMLWVFLGIASLPADVGFGESHPSPAPRHHADRAGVRPRSCREA